MNSESSDSCSPIRKPLDGCCNIWDDFDVSEVLSFIYLILEYVFNHLWFCFGLCFWFQIRRKMREIMVNQASSCNLKELVLKFIPEVIGKEIEKATFNIYPLQNVFIRKVKILKAPKFDLGKLMEVCSHQGPSFWY